MKHLVYCLAFLCIGLHAQSQTTLIPYGSSWKYLDNNTRPASWETSGFNDASWSSGNAELGYGDGDETTCVASGGGGSLCTPTGNKYITTYFRTSLSIADPNIYSDFTLNVRRDDGIIVYVNGAEVFRNNMPGGAPAHGTLASGAAADDGDTPQSTTVASSAFSAGTNVIAVEVHQNAASSSDLTFDLQLIGNIAPPPSTTLIAFGSSWKYLDNGSDQGTAWQATGFNDASWASGNGQLGYGDGDETTCVASGGGGSLCSPTGNKYITTYFRKTFNITGLGSFATISLNVVRDDGIIVYVNGVEVGRDNMPASVNYLSLAPAAIGGADESTPVSFTLCPSLFVEGSNTIAVELHQSDATSSDISFDLELLGNPAIAIPPSLTRGPYLQMGGQTQITVRWRTDVACIGRLEVGLSVGNYTSATSDESCPTTEHIVTVTGLTADTKYFYQVSSTDGTVLQGAADNFFTTVPPPSATRKIRIAAFGDCGRNSTTYQDQNLSNYQNFLSTNGIDAPDAWILLGDNAYTTGSDVEYTNNFFNIYGPTLLRNHKLYPAPGNHDYGNNAGNKPSRSMPYHQNFSVPQSGELGGVASNASNFYSYDIGNIHFLSLDSYGTEADLTDMGTAGSSTLKTWIDADLAANTQKWTIAYWHHPPYTKTSHNSDTESDLIAIRQNFITYLESRGVDLVINGHSHGYERGYMMRNYTGTWASFNGAVHAVSTSSATYTNGSTCPYVYNSTPLDHGTVYVVAGSTGASGGTQAEFGTGPLPFAVNDGGILYFEVEDNRLDAKMLRRNGTIFDQFTIMKDVNQSTTYNIVVGNNVTMTASWPGNYNWNTAATTQSINFTPASVGTTNFTVTDNFGCVTDQFTVNALATLPVSLLAFDVTLQTNNKVKVYWSTAAETHNDFYTIERSENGVDYAPVGTVNAIGNSTTRQDYVFYDDSPLPGTSYYRLSQTDIDNKTEYLGIKRIANNRSKAFEAKTLAGTPGFLVLQITAADPVKAYLRVFDMTGRERKNETLNVSPGVTRKEIYLGSGVYIWEIRKENGETLFQKVIIQ